MPPRYDTRSLALVALLPFVASVPAHAGQVLKTAGKKALVSIGSGDDWGPDDSVCFYRGAKKLGCGTVLRIVKEKALVSVGGVKLTKGDRVEGMGRPRETRRERPRESERETAAADVGESYGSANNRRFGKPIKFDLTAGMNASLNLFYPTIGFQYSILPYLSLGLRPSFFRLRSETSTLVSYGGIFTVNYYRDHHFKGLWGQLGAGAFLYNISQGSLSESPTTFVGLATIGWRLRFKSGLNIGIAGGVQYIGSPQSALVAIEFDGARPIAILDAGFAF